MRSRSACWPGCGRAAASRAARADRRRSSACGKLDFELADLTHLLALPNRVPTVLGRRVRTMQSVAAACGGARARNRLDRTGSGWYQVPGPSAARAAPANRKDRPDGHLRAPPAPPRPLDEGGGAPGAGDGRGAEGELGASGDADGHGRRRHRALRAAPEVRRQRAALAGPRPLRAVGRARVDAALRAPVPDRLRADDDRRAQAVPPARVADRRASRVRPRRGDRDDDRAARPGARQRGRHGDRRGEPARRGSGARSSTTIPR